MKVLSNIKLNVGTGSSSKVPSSTAAALRRTNVPGAIAPVVPPSSSSPAPSFQDEYSPALFQSPKSIAVQIASNVRGVRTDGPISIPGGPTEPAPAPPEPPGAPAAAAPAKVPAPVFFADPVAEVQPAPPPMFQAPPPPLVQRTIVETFHADDALEPTTGWTFTPAGAAPFIPPSEPVRVAPTPAPAAAEPCHCHDSEPPRSDKGKKAKAGAEAPTGNLWLVLSTLGGLVGGTTGALAGAIVGKMLDDREA